MNVGKSIDDREIEAVRRHSFGVAYRLLGGATEAEDAPNAAL
jgi:hypothetical protein